MRNIIDRHYENVRLEDIKYVTFNLAEWYKDSGNSYGRVNNITYTIQNFMRMNAALHWFIQDRLQKGLSYYGTEA